MTGGYGLALGRRSRLPKTCSWVAGLLLLLVGATSCQSSGEENASVAYPNGFRIPGQDVPEFEPVRNAIFAYVSTGNSDALRGAADCIKRVCERDERARRYKIGIATEICAVAETFARPEVAVELVKEMMASVIGPTLRDVERPVVAESTLGWLLRFDTINSLTNTGAIQFAASIAESAEGRKAIEQISLSDPRHAAAITTRLRLGGIRFAKDMTERASDAIGSGSSHLVLFLEHEMPCGREPDYEWMRRLVARGNWNRDRVAIVFSLGNGQPKSWNELQDIGVVQRDGEGALCTSVRMGIDHFPAWIEFDEGGKVRAAGLW